jgi:hypothetical protein
MDGMPNQRSIRRHSKFCFSTSVFLVFSYSNRPHMHPQSFPPSFLPSRSANRRSSKWFYRTLFGLPTIFYCYYYYNLESVPITGRVRFNALSPGFIQYLGSTFPGSKARYQDKILPQDHADTIYVEKVLILSFSCLIRRLHRSYFKLLDNLTIRFKIQKFT